MPCTDLWPLMCCQDRITESWCLNSGNASSSQRADERTCEARTEKATLKTWKVPEVLLPCRPGEEGSREGLSGTEQWLQVGLYAGRGCPKPWGDGRPLAACREQLVRRLEV